MSRHWIAFTGVAVMTAGLLAVATLATAQTAAETKPSAASGDTVKPGADKGQLAFNNTCRTCHTVREGDNRLGPNLAGIVGRKSASVSGFAYSDSLKKLDITWDEAALDRFIADPNAVAPGNNMKPYTGVASAEDRKAIIAHLKSGGE